MNYRDNYRHNYYGEMSRSSYNLLIGGILLWGFVINALMVKYATPYILGLNPIGLIIGYFALSIIGMVISAKSDSAIISFIGYNMVVVPVGAVLSVALIGASNVSIMNAVLVTGCAVAVMTLLGTIFPNFFMSMGRALFIALTAVVAIELLGILFGWHMPSFWDWLIAVLFSGYIAYDWAEAQYRPCTADDAVDACVGLYLDIVNLFLRILSISDDD
ncbi:MAG: Bax inhibitor-1 family protein [bacterium]|nr:Bax inhibitor-1 family protein [bacterium]